MTASAYAVLGVSPDSEDVVIRAAYRALMQKYTSLARLHEDVGADDRRAREIQAAYDAIEADRRRPAAEAEPEPEPEPEPTADPPPAFLHAPPPIVHAPRRRSGAAALVAVAVVAMAGGVAALWAVRPRPAGQADAAARPALQVRVGPPPAASPLARPMPCFVGGQSVGVLRLAECAARNGVASGPLEIGPPPPAPAAPAAKPAPVRDAVADDADVWRKVKAAAVRFAVQSLAAPDQKRVQPAPAAPRPAHPNPGPAPAPAETGSLNEQMAQLQGVDHLGQLLARLAPLVRQAQAPAPAQSAPATAPATAPREVAAPALVEPAMAIAEPRPAARESVAVVRDFYQALGEGDARLATALVDPAACESGSLSAERIRRFASSVRQPLRVTGIHAVDDSTVAVSYQYVSSANQLCQGAADVATTERDDHVLIRGIKSTYAC